MRRLAIVALLALPVATAAARGVHLQKGDLRVSFDADLAPRTLPRSRPAPVKVSLAGSIRTTDGTPPPPLRELSIAVNKAGRFSLAGLPACTASKLQQTTTEAALAACRGALVGHGTFGVDVNFPGSATIPARGKVLVFNASAHGQPGMLLHLYGSHPVRAAFVLPFSISHVRHGQLGTVFSTRIPELASGLGHVTDLSLEIGRSYPFQGTRHSVVSASCATLPGLSVGIFLFAKATFTFTDGRQLSGRLTRDCKVR